MTDDRSLTSEQLRQRILGLVEDYFRQAHTGQPFIPGQTPIPVSGKVYGAEEMRFLVDASLDFWLTAGRFNNTFQERLASYLGVRKVLTVNSGSSANLLAVAALSSEALGDQALKPGNEVITIAAGFPTTVNPLLMYGLIPVFVDVDIPTYNIMAGRVETAITDKTRAIVLAHTLGNPFDLGVLMQLVEKYNLWLIEDCCDALGATYKSQTVGTFGHIGTVSFYPAHHITFGEGGAVFTQDPQLAKILESIRDWGRDCWCPPGASNTCGKRFDWQLGELPYGYDHKYTYSNLGYNLKITDMQAAVGLPQMDRLPEFISTRKANFAYLKTGLASLEEYLILPEATLGSDPSWFGFPLTLHEGSGFQRHDLLQYLEEKKIATRLLFGGNLIRQPYFKGRNYRVHDDLTNSERIMDQSFWLGVFPGLSQEMLDYVIDQMHRFFRQNEK